MQGIGWELMNEGEGALRKADMPAEVIDAGDSEMQKCFAFGVNPVAQQRVHH